MNSEHSWKSVGSSWIIGYFRCSFETFSHFKWWRKLMLCFLQNYKAYFIASCFVREMWCVKVKHILCVYGSKSGHFRSYLLQLERMNRWTMLYVHNYYWCTIALSTLKWKKFKNSKESKVKEKKSIKVLAVY